jgi:NAD(P)-dependent dehydrogenase (short-subunit alcohol dehydrogenase family)
MDVTDSDSVERGFDHTENVLGPGATARYSAGIFDELALDDLSLAEWDRALTVNLTGTFLCVKRALANMREVRS